MEPLVQLVLKACRAKRATKGMWVMSVLRVHRDRKAWLESTVRTESMDATV